MDEEKITSRKSKKSAFRIIKNIVTVLVTVGVLYLFISSAMSALTSAKKPFLPSEDKILEPITQPIVLKPVDPEVEIEDGLDFNQYIEGQYTILALGMDEEGLNTDVMMLCLLDLNAGKIKILQIPRDTYVGPEMTYSDAHKINSVYSQGTYEGSDINKIVKCLNDMFGIPIDNYIGIKCTDVAPVVDAMGGIPMNVPDDIVYEADKLIPKGETVLSGEEAEWFVRYRSDYLQGDIGRIKAQRYFLAAAMQKVKNMGTLEILKIYPTLKDYIISGLSVKEIGMICDFANTVSMEDVTVKMLPGEALDQGDIDNYAGWTLHEKETIQLLNEEFRPYQERLYEDDLNIIEVKNTTTGYYDEGTNFDDIIAGKAEIAIKKADANEMPEDYVKPEKTITTAVETSAAGEE